MNPRRPRKMFEIYQSIYEVANLDLGVIQAEDLIFHFLDFVRPPVGCEITPLTQNGQNGNSNYVVANVDVGIIQPEDFEFHILDLVRLPVDHKPTPPMQNCQNEKNSFMGTPT